MNPAAVRVRPPLRSTDPGFELIPQRFQRSMVQVTSPTSLAIDSPQGRKLFVFDKVFGQDVDQEGIWDYLQESTNSFVQGYNVSMLAYGQSGAGKSYTMGTSGPAEQGDLEVMGEFVICCAVVQYCRIPVLHWYFPDAQLMRLTLLCQVSFLVPVRHYSRSLMDRNQIIEIQCPD